MSASERMNRKQLESWKEREGHDTNPGAITALVAEIEACWEDRENFFNFLGEVVAKYERCYGTPEAEKVIAAAKRMIAEHKGRIGK